MSTPKDLFNRLLAEREKKTKNMSNESESDEDTPNLAEEDSSTITGTLHSDATNGSSIEELRNLSLEELIKQYAVQQYFAQKLKNTKEVLAEKLKEKYNNLSKLLENEDTIRFLIKTGLRPTWPEEILEYERLKKRRKGLSIQESELKANLKKINENLKLQAKRFFSLLVKDVFPDAEPVDVVENSAPTKVGGIINYYDGIGQIEQTFNPNFAAHKVKIPFRMVISAPAGSGNVLVFFFLLKCVSYFIIFCCWLVGKTNFIRNLIDAFGCNTFGEVFIVTKTAAQLLYTDLKKNNSLVKFYDDVPLLEAFTASIQRLIIFDDMMEVSSLREITEFWTQGRHKGFSCVFATQMWFQLSSTIRLNSDYVAVLGFGGGRNQNLAISDICPEADREIVISFWNSCLEFSPAGGPIVPLVIYRNEPLSRKFRLGLLGDFFEYPPSKVSPIKGAPSQVSAPQLFAGSPAVTTAVTPPRPWQHARKKEINEMHQKGEVLRDLYETPATATQVLINTLVLNGISKDSTIWECCAGNSAISNVFRNSGFRNIIETDLFPTGEMRKLDFYNDTPSFQFDFLITNPPYDQKEHFLNKSLQYGKPFALLLPLESLKNRAFRDVNNRLQLLILNKSLKFKKEDGKEAMIPITAWFFFNFQPLEFQYQMNCGVSFSAVDTDVHAAVDTDVQAAVDTDVHTAVDTDVHTAVDSDVHTAVDSDDEIPELSPLPSIDLNELEDNMAAVSLN